MVSVFRTKLLLFFIAGVIAIHWSCQKQVFTTSSGDKLAFSADTLNFDTVFTTVGSAVGYIKIFNPHNKSIKISSISTSLNSYFHLNIDGVSGNSTTNLELRPHDSTYIFVTVKVNPTAANTPFVLFDSIMFFTNGNKQRVVLEAHGQNAHFIKGHIPCNTTWINDKPYVIMSGAQVDSNCTLTINGGCRIYAHPGAFLSVYGTLQVLGQQDSVHHVYFTGDRLEQFYKDVPGMWGGIVFYRGSKNNTIDYTVMNEGTQGIVAGIPGNAHYVATDFGISSNVPDVTIKHSTIKNFYTNGILAINSNLTMQNSLIFNTGNNAVSIGLGGTYTFNGCTIVNYGSVAINHQDADIAFTNYLVSSNTQYANDLNLQFLNSIIHGNITSGNEIARDSAPVSGSKYSYVFKNCLIESLQTAPAGNFINCISNQDPQFKNQGSFDFHILSTSPCVGRAISNALYDDITGKARGSSADIGAYQHN